jgi:hypothetical protein
MDRAKRLRLGWIVPVLCLLSFSRGLYQLGEQSLWWDESLSLHRAAQPFSFTFSNRILFLSGTEETPVTPDHHPPLYFTLLRILILAAGDSEFALRYLSLAACVLVVPLLYLCAKHLYDPVSGVCAALLGACSPLYLWAQQEARPYALVTLFAVTSFYALIRTLFDRSSDLRTDAHPVHRMSWSALYVLSTVAMLATHYHALLLLPAHGAMYLLAQRHHRGRTFWALLATGVVAGVIALYGLRKIAPRGEIPTYVFIPLGTLLQDVLRSFPLGVSGTRLVLFQWVSVGMLLAALIVLFTRPKRSSRRYAACLLLCFALPVAGAARAYSVQSSRKTRISIGALAGLAMGILLVGMGLSTYTFFVDPLYDKEDHRAWGRYLDEHVRPNDVVFVYPGAVYELYRYYTSSTAPYYGIPLLGASPEQTLQYVLDIARHYDRLWIAHSLTPSWAYSRDITLDWLREQAVQIALVKFQGHANRFPVYAFSLEPPVTASLPAEARPLALDFGGQLRLLGSRAVSEQVLAGRPLQLSLYWSATRILDRGYRFTLSLRDSAGTSWSSLDYVPYKGMYPLAQWPLDGIVRDDIDIDIPPGTPPGRYWVNVSVYPADRSGPSLAVTDSDSGLLMGLIVPVAEIAVSRPDVPPRDAEIPIPSRARRRYGDLVLLGHNYRGSAYQPGDIVSLDLYWRALRAPDQDLTFALQLTDESGEIRAARTIAPAAGYPTSSWHRGEVVRGKYRFRFPLDVPEGDYALWLAPGSEGPSSGIWPLGNQRVRLDTLSLLPADDEYTLETPSMQHPLRANLGDRVELLGYDLESNTIQPGQVVSCTLYWRGLQEMERSYTVFTHLVDPDGQTWGQWDNQPQRGQAPTTSWFPGQVIADSYQTPLSDAAPTGPLALHIGMYDLRTMVRLPLIDENGTSTGDSIVVAEIDVVSDSQ